MKEYISELIPTFNHLNNMDEEFKEKYILGAMKKFTLFLNPKSRIYIKDMLTSPSWPNFMSSDRRGTKKKSTKTGKYPIIEGSPSPT